MKNLALMIAAGVGVALASSKAAALAGPINSLQWANLQAFMRVIRDGESGDNYYRLVGPYAEFEDDSAHPKISENWPGIRRPDGRLTTAAGAYQITFTTYQSLGGGAFDPDSQDLMAVRLLIRRGAYDAVCNGRAIEAGNLLRDEWEIFALPRYSGANLASMFETSGGYTA